MVPKLETVQLILRQLLPGDATRIQELFPVWEVVKYLSAAVPWPYPENGATEFLARVSLEHEQGKRYPWAITLKTDPESQLIGVIELFPSNPEEHRGFWLGSAYHNRGYMREAAAAVTDCAFDSLKLPFLLLGNCELNMPSHQIKLRSGAELIAVQEDVPFVAGRFRCERWKLTPDAWRAARETASS